MAKGQSMRIRMSMDVPEELLRQIDAWADHYGVTRTAYVTMALSQKVQSEELTMALPEMQRVLLEMQRVVDLQQPQAAGAPIT